MKKYRIMTEEQARAFAGIAQSLEWSEGKARTAALTGSVKCNEEILAHPSLDEIGKMILRPAAVQLDTVPLKLHSPKYSRYQDGNRYKAHTDSPWMAVTRTDLSCTLWLNDEYEGGELSINGLKLKGKPGECVIYECGEPHEVMPVTAGARIAVITWIQSRIRDPIKRKWISDMRKFLAGFEDDTERFLEGSRLYSAMLRRWTE